MALAFLAIYSPGHISHRYDNIYDIEGIEVIVNWTSAEEDYRYSHKGYTYYY